MNRALVQLNQFACQRKADAGSLMLRAMRSVDLVEAIKDQRNLVCRNTYLCVSDTHEDLVRYYCHRNLNRASLRSEYEGVGEKVADDFYELVSVYVHLDDIGG